MNKFKTLALVLGMCVGVVVATSSSATINNDISGALALSVDGDSGSSSSSKSSKKSKSKKKSKKSSSKSGSSKSSSSKSSSSKSSKSSKGSGPVVPPPPPPPPPEPTCVNIILTFDFDMLPCDNAYELKDLTAGIVLDAKNYYDLCGFENQQNVQVFQSCVDPAHCYSLTVMDQFCDGLCCFFGSGTYELCIGDVNPECVASPTAGGFICDETVQVGGACVDLHDGGQKDVALDGAGLSITTFPNPVVSTATFDFALEQEDRAVVTVVDVNGSVVGTAFDAVVNANEMNRVNFDASELSSGIYFVQLTSSTDSKREKIMIVK